MDEALVFCVKCALVSAVNKAKKMRGQDWEALNCRICNDGRTMVKSIKNEARMRVVDGARVP